MAKTQEEREYIKRLKKESKHKPGFEFGPIIQREPLKQSILTGLVEGEYPLDSKHPVHGDYLYVVEYEECSEIKYKVIRSDIFGDVQRLKIDLGRKYQTIINIYNCSIGKRNLF